MLLEALHALKSFQQASSTAELDSCYFFPGNRKTHLWKKSYVKTHSHVHRQEHDCFVSLFFECPHEQSQESTLTLAAGAERWSRNKTGLDCFPYTECLASLLSFR